MHLAHFASPVMVIPFDLLAAKVGVASASNRRPAMPASSNDVLFIFYFPFVQLGKSPTKIRQPGLAIVQTGNSPSVIRGASG
jgi:hypothetical protein